MNLTQNEIERLKDLMELGELTADQANVEKVKIARVQMVINKLPAAVRKALNSAVRSGELGHLKKDGHKPETYYHKSFEHLAIGARNTRERSIKNSCGGAYAAIQTLIGGKQ